MFCEVNIYIFFIIYRIVYFKYVFELIFSDFDLSTLVEPMVWHYNAREHFQLGPSLWDKYSSVFPRIWAASAFKGATGSCQVMIHNVYTNY